MNKARIIGKSLIYRGMSFHIETMNFSHMDWMKRNGLEETETVETATGERFTIYANYARCLACAISV
jgi:seryl-tRNA synthetase